MKLTRFPRAFEIPSVRIEPAYDCDGCICNQPLFGSDGVLHVVAPHYHLVEWDGEGLRHYAISLTSTELDRPA